MLFWLWAFTNKVYFLRSFVMLSLFGNVTYNPQNTAVLFSLEQVVFDFLWII